MKRITRRTLGVCIGIALGWYVAGLAPSFMPGLRVSMAEDTDHHAAPTATTQPSSDSHEVLTQEPATHEDAGHEEEGRRAAEQLVPRDRAQQVPWFWPVVIAAVGLFIAAVVLGIPSLKLRGPLPPDPADSPHDDHAAHDDHGHDDHDKAAHH